MVNILYNLEGGVIYCLLDAPNKGVMEKHHDKIGDLTGHGYGGCMKVQILEYAKTADERVTGGKWKSIAAEFTNLEKSDARNKKVDHMCGSHLISRY